MNRFRDWHKRMCAAIDKHRALPFQWGVSDCVTFPADCVEAITGTDPLGDRHYSTQIGAALKMKARGVDNVGDAFKTLFPEIAPAMAGVGDLVVVEIDGQPGGGICIGAMVACKAETGLSFLPRDRAVRAFKVQ